MSGVGVKIKTSKGGGAPPLASAPEGPRRTPPNGGDPRNAPDTAVVFQSVGKIQHHVRIGELVDAKSGFACGEDSPEGVFQFRMNNITPDGRIDYSKKRRVPQDTKKIQEYFLRPGDVLFNATNSPELVGKSAHFSGNIEHATFSNHFFRLRPNPLKMEGRYLAYWLTFQFQKQVFRGLCKQWVNQASVSRDSLLELQIPLPPLPEQRRIAEVLDRAEGLRAKRRDSILQAEQLLQSIFIEFFEGSNGQGWPHESIADVVHPNKGSIRTGPFGSQLLTSEFVDAGIAVLGIDNAVSNEFRWGERRFISLKKYEALKRYTVKPGDVLITIMGTCGRCAVVPDDIPTAINTKHLCCITLNPKKCLPIFLHEYFLRHSTAKRYLENRAKGAIMAGLNMGLIEEMPILLPPLAIQQEFARRIAAVEKLKVAHRASLAQLDTLFASLQHRAFRGKL